MFSKFPKSVLHGLGLRIAIYNFGFFLAGAMLIFSLLYFVVSSSLQKNDRELISAQMDELSLVFEKDGVPGVKKLIMEQSPETETWLFTQVLTSTGEVLVRYVPLDSIGFDFSKLDEFSRAQGQEESLGRVWLDLKNDGSSDQMEVISLHHSHGHILQVGRLTDGRNAELRRLRIAFLTLVIPLLFIAALGGLFVSRQALTPVRNLIAALKRFQEGEMSPMVPEPSSQDELFELTVLFNLMLSRIKILIEGMRRTVENVAHDLKTPLTRFRSSAELALHRESKLTDAEKVHLFRETLIECLENTEKIQTLVDAVMDITQAESGTLHLHKELCDLNAIVNEVLDLYEIVADEKNVKIEFHSGNVEKVLIDPLHFRRAIANLIDNAIKYNRSGGSIDIETSLQKGQTRLTISDTGIGIDESDITHIWERLYRADRSRSEKGLGLGLSMVKAIIEAHGAQISCESGAEGTRFSILL